MPPQRQERQQDWAKMTPRQKALSYLGRAAAGAYATMEVTDLMREGVPLNSAAMNDLAALTGVLRDLVSRAGGTL